MKPKEAVTVAKTHVIDLFGDEGITELGLEEIESDGSCWKITIGFSRTWGGGIGSILSGSKRAYKVLRVSKTDGQMLAVRDRNLPNTFI